MARGINKVIIVGNCGNDPETSVMPSGGAVANVSIATTESWNDKSTGQKQEKTEWHRVVFFNRLAEIVGQYIRKGSQIYIEGSLRTRKWQDQNGQDRYSTEVVAREMQMLGGRNDAMGGGAPMGDMGGFGAPQQQAPMNTGFGGQPGFGGGAPSGFDQQGGFGGAPAHQAAQQPAQQQPMSRPAAPQQTAAPQQPAAPQQRPAQPMQPAPMQSPAQQPASPSPAAGGFDSFDDDIPF